MADQELTLVNRVELRLVMTNNDKKFEDAVQLYLPPLLLKLCSPHEQVRTKVVEVCDHINQRLPKTSKMPNKKLLEDFSNGNLQGNRYMMQTFQLMYVNKSIDNMDQKERDELLPIVINCLDKTENKTLLTSLLHTMVTLFRTWTPPEEKHVDEWVKSLNLKERPEIESLLQQKFIEMFGTQLTNSLLRENSSVTHSLRDSYFSSITIPSILSNNGSATSANPRTQLFEAKKGIIKFLEIGGLREELAFVPMLASSQDENADIAQMGKDRFKRISTSVAEKPEVVDALYGLFSGPKKLYGVIKAAIKVMSKSEPALAKDPNLVINQGFAYSSDDVNDATIDFARNAFNSVREKFDENLIMEIVDTVKDYLSYGTTHGNVQMEAKQVNGVRFLGLLFKKVPSLITEPNLEMLFQCLEGKTFNGEFKLAVQSALSEILAKIPYSDEKTTKIKERMLYYLIEPECDVICKSAAVRYAARVAPFEDPEARILCLLGMHKKNRTDTIEEARRGLHPHWHRLSTGDMLDKSTLDGTNPFPSFDRFLNVIEGVTQTLKNKHVSSSLYDYSVDTYCATVTTLEQVLAMQASAAANNKTILVVDESWDSRLETAINLDKGVRSDIRRYLQSGELSEDSLGYFIKLMLQGVKKGIATVGETWIRILSYSSHPIVERCVDMVGDLVALLDHANVRVREIAAHAIGIIATCDKYENGDELINKFSSELQESTRFSGEKAHGRLLALSYILSRRALRAGSPVEIPSFFNEYTAKVLSQNRLDVRDAATDSVFQLAMAQCIEPGQELKDQLKEISRKHNSEKAILAYSALSAVDETNRREYIDSIIEINDSKHVEFMFASGEALSIAACGWESAVTDRNLDLSGISPQSSNLELDYALEKVFDACKTNKPRGKKFACLWLLSLTQYCGHLGAVKQNLGKIHTNFMRFLSTGDDIVQESASRGLGIIYEMGDENLKSDLVRGLVQSFTAERKMAGGSVSEDTELFAPGVLDTGDGSVSTYKDILNLASEVGDPSLVYKFMSLAAHSSLWASRRGAAFGLGSILSKANLDEVFENNKRLSKSLIPKLYRYRFDPNGSVRESMRGIWDTLISDKQRAVKDNFNDILDELLKSMGSREWRVREASTNALADLLQTGRISQYQDRLEEIWKMAFRVVDDIKDSVRTAAMSLIRGLATTMVRHVDVESGASEKLASKILKDMIPFLTGNYGLQSDAQEVSGFALDTVLKLCKQGGKALKPYIPQLIVELLDLMSTLEPQAMNYLAMNADKYGLTTNDIDASRMKSLRNSPIMDAVEQMIELLDAELLKELAPQLVIVIRKSVGLPSKLSAGRVIVILVVKRLHQVAVHADALLKACQSQLENINDTVSQSYAVSAGYLCRVASESAVLRYQSSLEPLYFDRDDRRLRLAAGHAAAAVAKHATDKFESVASAFLPFIFVGKHDTDDEVHKVFDQTWNDNTGGTGAVKLHLKEIVSLCSKQLLNNQQWGMRQVAARSVADASTVIDVSTTGADSNNELFEVLLEACKGRSWEGKELVLDALVKLCGRAKETLKANTQLLDRVRTLVVAEAKRRNKQYQSKAIVSLGEFAAEFPSADLYEVLFEQAEPHLTGSGDDEDEDGDTHIANSAQSIAREDKRTDILVSVVGSYRSVGADGGVVDEQVLVQVCDLIIKIFKSEHDQNAAIPVTWRTKNRLMNAIIKLIPNVPGKSKLQPVWHAVLEHCAMDQNHERIRTEAVRVGSALKAEGLDVSEDLKRLRANEQSTVVLAELDRAI